MPSIRKIPAGIARATPTPDPTRNARPPHAAPGKGSVASTARWITTAGACLTDAHGDLIDLVFFRIEKLLSPT
jgi:hypothetical protein